MARTTPKQMFDHTLDAPKGWFHMAALDFPAKLSSEVTIDAYAGRCVHLNADGEFEMGCVGDQMPIFLLQNSYDADVDNYGGTYWYPIGPTGTINGLVGKGAYMLETTEFDPDQEYAPNDPLRAIASNSNQTTGGRLTNQGVVKVASGTPAAATAVVGHVAIPPRKRQSDRKKVLCFWPGHHPGAAGL